MEAEVDVAAEVALLVKAIAMVVIELTPAGSGRVMMIRCLQRLPLMVVLSMVCKSCGWNTTHITGHRVEYHPYNWIS